jgi:uncharacterized protein YggE
MRNHSKLIALSSAALVAAYLFLIPSTAHAATDRYVSVSATGTVKVKPDAVRLNMTVSNVASTSAIALSTNNSSASKVREALTSNGIVAQFIKSTSVTTYPEYNYTSSGGSTLVGYRASQTFDVVIRNAANAGSIVDAVVAAGGDLLSVNGVTPFVYDDTAATQSARTDAVKKAKAKALSYAKLLGVKLGSVVFLEESSGSNPYPVVMAMAKSDAGATTVDLGQQDVTVSVSTKWSISG